MHTTLPGPHLARLGVTYNWQDEAYGLGFTGDSPTFMITCASGTLRLCLTWTDLPGRGLLNRLALGHHPLVSLVGQPLLALFAGSECGSREVNCAPDKAGRKLSGCRVN